MTNIEDIRKMDLHRGDPIEVELSSPRGTTKLKGHYERLNETWFKTGICGTEIEFYDADVITGESKLKSLLVNDQMRVRKLQYQ